MANKRDKFDVNDYKCAIFDVDGTLIDSMPMWGRITFEFAEEHGLVAPKGLDKVMNSMSLSQCAEYYVNNIGVPGSVDEVASQIVDMARERYRTVVDEKPGAVKFVKYLHDNGIRICLATASEISAIIPALQRLGIMEYIDFHLSCVDIGISKETPEIYCSCAEHFGFAVDECAVFEDALYAAQTAQKAGFFLVGIEDGVHSDADRNQLESISDIYIRDYDEIM